MKLGGPTVQTGAPFQIIRYSGPGNYGTLGTQYIQIANTQGLSQLPFILSSTGGPITASPGGVPFPGVSASGLFQSTIPIGGVHQVSNAQIPLTGVRTDRVNEFNNT